MKTLSTFEPHALFAGDFPRATEGVTLLAGQVYPEGAALGKIIASGKCTLADKAASDGSEEIHGILSEAVDATDSDRESVVYLTGEFVAQRVTFAAGSTVADFTAAAREKSIFFKDAATQPNE